MITRQMPTKASNEPYSLIVVRVHKKNKSIRHLFGSTIVPDDSPICVREPDEPEMVRCFSLLTQSF